MKVQSSLAVVAALLLASPVSAAEPAAQPAAATAASSAIPPAPADKGQVVFFRRSSLMGMPYWTNIRENEVAYGKLTNGVYFVQTLEPGLHTFDTSVLGKDSLKLEIDAGETYYVEGKITMAVLGYTIVMAPSDAAAFQKVFKGLKVAKPVEAAPEAAKPVAPE